MRAKPSLVIRTSLLHRDFMSQEDSLSVAIIADDLTSAADGAAPFVVNGLSACVGRRKVPDGTFDVCAVDIGTRSDNPQAAASKTERFADKLKSANYILKTVDSTLRGHVREEISAAFRASGRRRLVFAPAFPSAGRTTIGGVQHIRGVPVHLTEYARDPVHPASVSRLSDLLDVETADKTVLDAKTQAELNDQVSQIEQPDEVMWVGSPGLAQALAERIKRVFEAQTLPRSNKPCLVAVGSANKLSHRQAAVLPSGFTTVITAPAQRTGTPDQVLATLADDAARHLATGCFGALIATGGDTMEAILDRTDIHEFALYGEIEPGFPLGSACIANQKILLGMKAGGFGDDETLLRAVHRLNIKSKELAS